MIILKYLHCLLKMQFLTFLTFFALKLTLYLCFFLFFLTFAVNSAFYKVKFMSVKIRAWQKIIHRVINHHNGSYIVFDNKYGKAWKDKCPDKVMVRIAISNCGISKPLFRPSKSEAVDSDMYIIVYKASFHSWASPRLKLYFLAWFSRLYSKQTVAWMDENVNFVPKRFNPPNVLPTKQCKYFKMII